MAPNQNPFSRFDWNQFEDYFRGMMPHNPGESRHSSHWIEDYVKQILKDNLSPRNSYTNMNQYDTEMRESLDHLMMKIYIPDKEQAQKLSVYTSDHQVKLEGKDGHEIQWFRLPHPVIPISCKAEYKDGALQLRMRKRTKEEPFHQVNVDF